MNARLEALLAAAPPHPRRVVCLTEETTETLYRIGAGDLVVGVSGFTMRPPAARQKPKVSTFLDADFDRILELRPDLVLGFSDLQADLAAELARRGVAVHLFNQRSVAEILQSIRTVAGLVGRHDEGDRLALALTANLDRLADAAPVRRPRVFFEEWPDPLISGIRWVSELVELVGGDPLFPETRAAQGAVGRIIAPDAVPPRDPEVIVASWCGKKAVRRTIVGRPGWDATPAVRDDQIYEVRSVDILQPGPAALTDGAEQLARIVAAVARGERLPAPRQGFLRHAGLS